MTTQIEMFPAKEADRAQVVLNYLLTQRDKAEKAVANAEEKLSDICALIDKQQRVLALLRDHSVSQSTDEVEIVEDAEVTEEEPDRIGIDGVALADDGTEYETATGEVVDPEAIVYLQRPNGGNAFPTDVGEQTRFGELVADYLTEEGLDAEVTDFQIIGPEGMERSLRDAIPRGMWGQTFRVVRKGREADEEPWEYEKPEPAQEESAA